MSLRDLTIRVNLPAKPLSRVAVREILRLIFEEFRWFTPMRYGLGFDQRVPPGSLGFEEMLGYYDEKKHLPVAAKTDVNFISIHPIKADSQYPYAGSLSWSTIERAALKPELRATLEGQIKRLMTLLDSPLTYAALDDDIDSKTERWVARGGYREQVRTVHDYSEGLAGLFWRNFFGPPFVRMFGERLASIPAPYRRDLGDGIVLVEPYPLPGDAETPEGKARERELIQLLGPECFYDHERHVPPTRRPELPPLEKPPAP